jgi:hypothetical protein
MESRNPLAVNCLLLQIKQTLVDVHKGRKINIEHAGKGNETLRTQTLRLRLMNLAM